MTSLILTTASRYLLPMLLLFAAFLFLRGHNLPGGGFSGGMVAAGGFALYAFGHGMGEARQLLRIAPPVLLGAGLLLALGSGSVALLGGDPFLTARWSEFVPEAAVGIKIGTPLFFDLAVFLVVIGATVAIVLTLGEED